MKLSERLIAAIPDLVRPLEITSEWTIPKVAEALDTQFEVKIEVSIDDVLRLDYTDVHFERYVQRFAALREAWAKHGVRIYNMSVGPSVRPVYTLTFSRF